MVSIYNYIHCNGNVKLTICVATETTCNNICQRQQTSKMVILDTCDSGNFKQQ